MTGKLKVGIAGYGVVGKRRRHFIDLHPALDTIAVCDRALTGNETDNDGIHYHANYKTLLDENIDMLFVCLPNDIAPQVTISGLQNGLHVLCEKPPGRNVHDIKRVIDVEKKYPGLVLKYGFNHRYHDSVRDALKLLENGALGQVLNLRGVYGKSKFVSYGKYSDWRIDREISGGGILLDQGIHMVDLMRLFAGEFTDVYSFVSNGYWKHTVEDNAYALMRTASGTVAMLHSTATQWQHRFNLEITCTKGAIILSGILSGSKSYGTETMTVLWKSEYDKGAPKEEVTYYNHDPSWADEIDEFTTAVLKGVAIKNGSSEDALKTMELVSRIYSADPEWAAQWNL